MKNTRLNLCETVRNALLVCGYSTVKTVNAVNSELGKLDKSATRETSKLGDGRLTKSEFKVTESTSISDTYSGKVTTPLRFDAWNSAVAKMEKIAGAFDKDETMPIPVMFKSWLDGFAKAEKKELEAEKQIA